MVQTRRPKNSDGAGDEFVPEEDVLVWNSSTEESTEEENSAEEAEEMPQTEAEARAEARARHRARMRALLDERDQLRLQALQEDELLRQEIARRDEALRRVQFMEERRRQLLLQREQDIAELAALDAAGNAVAEVDTAVKVDAEADNNKDKKE